LSILNVRHTTVYRYRRPVALGDHRLMLRPRDSHDLRLIQTNLNLSPPATLRWSHDVFGNSIAIASFAEPSTELRIESSLQLETYVVKRPAFQITPEAVSYRSVSMNTSQPISPNACLILFFALSAAI
jgi:transglutaminase-like putative cysteine protease